MLPKGAGRMWGGSSHASQGHQDPSAVETPDTLTCGKLTLKPHSQLLFLLLRQGTWQKRPREGSQFEGAKSIMKENLGWDHDVGVPSALTEGLREMVLTTSSFSFSLGTSTKE